MARPRGPRRSFPVSSLSLQCGHRAAAISQRRRPVARNGGAARRPSEEGEREPGAAPPLGLTARPLRPLPPESPLSARGSASWAAAGGGGRAKGGAPSLPPCPPPRSPAPRPLPRGRPPHTRADTRSRRRQRWETPGGTDPPARGRTDTLSASRRGGDAGTLGRTRVPPDRRPHGLTGANARPHAGTDTRTHPHSPADVHSVTHTRVPRRAATLAATRRSWSADTHARTHTRWCRLVLKIHTRRCSAGPQARTATPLWTFAPSRRPPAAQAPRHSHSQPTRGLARAFQRHTHKARSPRHTPHTQARLGRHTSAAHTIAQRRRTWAPAAFEIQIRAPFLSSATPRPRTSPPPCWLQPHDGRPPGAEIKIHFKGDQRRALCERGGVRGALGERAPALPAMRP